MSDLLPGVKRYPLEQRRPVKVDAGYLAVTVVVSLFGAVAMALLLFDAAVLPVLVIAMVGTLVPPATVLLPPVGRVLLIGISGIGALAWAADSTERSMGYVVCLLGACTTGGALLSALLFRRWWARRQESAEGAPASDLDPRGGKDVGVLAVWKEATYEYEAVDPEPDLVLDAVRTLDGGERSAVSVFRGRGRLDVGGDASGRMVVQQSDDRKHWHQVLDPTEPEGPSAAKGKTHVVVAGVVLPYPHGG